MPRRAPRTQRQPPLPGAPSAAEGARGSRAARACSRGNLSPQGRAGKANSTVHVAPPPWRGEPLTALALPLGPHRPAGWPVAPCGRTPFPLPPPLGALPGEGPGPAFPSRRRDVAVTGPGAPSACQLACAQAQLGPQPPPSRPPSDAPSKPWPDPDWDEQAVTIPSPARVPDTSKADASSRGPRPGCPLHLLGHQPGCGRRAEFHVQSDPPSDRVTSAVHAFSCPGLRGPGRQPRQPGVPLPAAPPADETLGLRPPCEVR